jgi:hypothetical protein
MASGNRGRGGSDKLGISAGAFGGMACPHNRDGAQFTAVSLQQLVTDDDDPQVAGDRWKEHE